MLLSPCFADKEPKADWFYLLRSRGEWLKGEGPSQVFAGLQSSSWAEAGLRPQWLWHDPQILQLPMRPKRAM